MQNMGIYFNISLILLCFLLVQVCCLLEGAQNQTIEAKILQMETEIAQLRQKVEEVDDLRQTVSSLQAKLDAHVKQDVPVAFTATLSATISNLGSHQHIVFDKILTNAGNAYSTQHGYFSAPVRGLYAFFVVLTSYPLKSVSASLMRNGIEIGHVLVHGTSVDLHMTSTLAVTVQLEVGDQVWVQHEYSTSAVEVLDGYDWSLFSGHLIGAN